MKRGQVTIYMIIGLVILILIILLFYFRVSLLKQIIKEKEIEITSVPEQFKDVQQEIKTCADKFVLDSIYALGVYGGYFYRDKINTIEYLGVNITYLHYGKKSYMPSIDIMEQELNKFINEDLLFNCKITSGNINVTYGKVSSSVDIKNTNIIVNINWHIKLKKGSLTSEIDKISLNYPIRLGELRNLINEMVKQQIKDKPQLCLTCMARTAADNNLFVNTYNQDDAVIFLVTDMKEQKDFDLYTFWYAGDYK